MLRLLFTVALLLVALLLAALPHRARRRKSRKSWRVPLRPISKRHHRKPEWVRQEVIRLKAISDQSCHKLAATFNRMYASERKITVGKTWVAEVIRSHRYEIAEMRKTYKRRIPAPLPVNVIWGFDMTGKADTAGSIHPIAGIVDHGSRLALALQPLPDKTSLAALKVLISAIEIFGKPEIIRTDNDAAFTSRLFRFGLSLLGIRHKLSTPGCPWQNGRIERLFGTLKNKLNQFAVTDFNGLGLALAQFQFWYNHVRPHAHLHNWTPAEAWLGIDPHNLLPKSAHRYSAWEGLLEGIYLRR